MYTALQATPSLIMSSSSPLANKFHTKLFSYFFVSLLITLSFITPNTKASTNFIYAACFPSINPSNSAFQSNLNSLLTSIANSASLSSYNTFNSSSPDSAAYGLYQCRNDLSSADCSSCVRSAVSQLGLLCPGTYTATLQLDGCMVRYSNQDFLGKLDSPSAAAYKQCSRDTAGGGDGGEFFRRRDDVLGVLESGKGYFRVTGSGMVQGFAQCVEDLNAGDCAACLREAVQQLRNACGESMAGDLFLGQCYARYWASGYYPRAANAAGYNEDDVGRTVAIIVGILAGVALLVVFFSFMKKAC